MRACVVPGAKEGRGPRHDSPAFRCHSQFTWRHFSATRGCIHACMLSGNAHLCKSPTSPSAGLMSAATALQCVVCLGASAKYKCPTCRGATCSLPCAKEHAAQGHPSQGQASGSSLAAATPAPGPLHPSLQLRNDFVDTPSSSRFSRVGQYVGMNEYDSTQLMEDFEYLQYVGKAVTLLGRDIAKSGWMRDGEQLSGGRGAAQPPPSQQRGPGRGANQHLPTEVRNRQTFEGWLRKLRLPIMLVPDGMSWRRENQTRWKIKTRQLLCTVEIRFASQSPSSGASRSLVHHVVWDKQFEDVTCNELERRAKQKGKSAESETGKGLDMGAFVGESLGQALPNDRRWRDSICLAVNISNDRLRNESSSKFLEWWQRQVKNGMVKADGLAFDEEKRSALEQLRRGDWGVIEGMGSEEQGWLGAPARGSDEAGVAKVEQQAQQQQSTDKGLISLSLLGKMQAARAKLAQSSEPAGADQQGGTPQQSSPSSTEPRRTLVLLDGTETFQTFLQRLPKGYAIVEYFHIEVWDKRRLLGLIDRGQILRERLVGSETAEGTTGWTVEPEEGTGKRSRRDDEGGATKKPKTGETGGDDALGGLAAYASSEEEDEKPEHGDSSSDEAGLEAGAGLAQMARSLGMVAG